MSPRRLQLAVPRQPEDGVRLGNGKVDGSFIQGEFDGLCGLYAVINALTLLPGVDNLLTYSQCETLFKLGVSFLEERNILGLGVRWGVGPPSWRDLVDHVIAAARQQCSRPISVLRHFVHAPSVTLGGFIDAAEFAVRNKQPVLIQLRGQHSHYTVISGFTPTRLLLHDSFGHAWLNKAACTTNDVDVSRHRIVPASFTALELG